MGALSKNLKEYLEALYNLNQNGRTARTKEISDQLGVSPASVTEMLRKLADEGYVNYSPYQGATLTDKGLRVAERVARKHRLLERFLHNVLKIGKERVHKQACEMEHSLSDEAEKALCQFLKYPDRCPDDEKIIPPCELQFSSCEKCLRRSSESTEEVGRRGENLVSVYDLSEHEVGKIAFIRGDHKVLKRLLDMGLTPGTSVGVVRVAPFKGPIEVQVRGSKLAIGQDIASNIFVEIARENTGGQ